MIINKRQSLGDKIFDVANTIFLLIVLFIILYPLMFVVSASFSNPLRVLQGEVWIWPKEFNLNAYERVFRNSDIRTGYKNTIIYTVLGTCITLL